MEKEMDEGRKRTLGVIAAIFACRELAEPRAENVLACTARRSLGQDMHWLIASHKRLANLPERCCWKTFPFGPSASGYRAGEW
jgi:hypothetical protein